MRWILLILSSVALGLVLKWSRARSAPAAGAPVPPAGGAPRSGSRYTNRAPQADGLSLLGTLGFFGRRLWVTLAPRPGAAPRVPYDSAAIARSPSLTWIGHSTFLVRMDGVTFLTDPMFSERASPLSFAGPHRLAPPGVPLDALPAVDFVLLSHDHYDHTDVRSVKELARRGVTFVVPMGLGEWVRRAGGVAIELDWWQAVELHGVRIQSVPAQHFSGRSLLDGKRRSWSGWVVSGPTRRFYHAGDTGYSPEFGAIGERLGPIDLAAVPIGAYRPAAMMHPVTRPRRRRSGSAWTSMPGASWPCTSAPSTWPTSPWTSRRADFGPRPSGWISGPIEPGS